MDETLIVCNRLENEWHDCLSGFRIVFEFSFVVSMFAQCPHGHLIESSHGENECWHAARQNRKAYPGTHFVGVIWTGHKTVNRKKTTIEISLKRIPMNIWRALIICAIEENPKCNFRLNGAGSYRVYCAGDIVLSRSVDLTWFTHLNSCVSGFESGTGIFRTRVPGGRRFRNAICVDKLPNSHSWKFNKMRCDYIYAARPKQTVKLNTYRKSAQPNVQLERRWWRE